MANRDDLVASADLSSQNGECHIYCTCVNVYGRVMVVEEVAQTVFGVNVPGRVMVVEEVAQTVFGVNVPGRVMVAEEVAQTVFGVNVPG